MYFYKFFRIQKLSYSSVARKIYGLNTKMCCVVVTPDTLLNTMGWLDKYSITAFSSFARMDCAIINNNILLPEYLNSGYKENDELLICGYSAYEKSKLLETLFTTLADENDEEHIKLLVMTISQLI